MEKHEIYGTLKRECLPLMQGYTTDLTIHDFNFICENDCPFIHITRELGTHIVALVTADWYPEKHKQVPYIFGKAGRDHLMKGNTKGILDFCIREKNALKIMYYDGWGMHEITEKRAQEIVNMYIEEIQKEWHKEDRIALKAIIDRIGGKTDE